MFQVLTRGTEIILVVFPSPFFPPMLVFSLHPLPCYYSSTFTVTGIHPAFPPVCSLSAAVHLKARMWQNKYKSLFPSTLLSSLRYLNIQMSVSREQCSFINYPTQRAFWAHSGKGIEMRIQIKACFKQTSRFCPSADAPLKAQKSTTLMSLLKTFFSGCLWATVCSCSRGLQ